MSGPVGLVGTSQRTTPSLPTPSECGPKSMAPLAAVAPEPPLAAVAPEPEPPLYKDDCCEVHTDRVIIKWYYFPTAGSKTVSLVDLQMIHPTPETSLSAWGRSTWGMGLGKTWWACAPTDSYGSRHSHAIVLQDSSWCRNGFSARQQDAAVKALSSALKASGRTVPNALDLPERTDQHQADRLDPFEEGSLDHLK